MNATQINKDLTAYDKAVDDLINSILDSEEEMSRSIGQYIFEQVGYTLHGDKDTQSLKGLINQGLVNYSDANCKDWKSLDIDEFYSYLTFGMSTKRAPIWLDCGNDSIALQGHGPRFADLVENILNEIGVVDISTLSKLFETQNLAYGFFDSVFDEFWSKQNLTDSLGLMYLLVGSEYDPATDKLVAPKDDSIIDLADFFTLTYDLFSALKTAPAAAVVEIDDLLNMLGVSGAEMEIISKVQAHILKGLSHEEGIFESSKRTYNDVILDMLIGGILDSWEDKIINQAQAVSKQAENIQQTHGADLDELVKSYQQFSQCVEACERGQIAEPYGTCTLSEIKKNEGFGGVTGITGELGYTVDYGPLGMVDISQSGQIASINAGEQAEAQRARLGVGDLKDLSTIGDPANNPLGQALQIMEKSQRQSAEVKERELQESQRAFASDKDLVSGEIKMPGSQVEARLNNALSDIRAANNAYTDSILAQMWGVFFNTLYKEFINNLYNKGFEPKLYGGPFNPETRQAFGTGVAAAQQQFGRLVNSQNITIGGAMNTEILSNLTSSCSEYAKCGFDQNIINTNWGQAIEQKMTLAEAMDLKNNLISKSSIFGFKNAEGGQPDKDEGISYNSMIVLRKYRVIPASWEAAAIWVRDVALKTQKQVTLKEVTDGYKNSNSPYFGLVNPYWVLKLPLFQCHRQGAGEEIVSEMAQPFSSDFTEQGDFTVQMSRMNNYCGDPQSCIREKTDGSGCESNGWGYCSKERDFWRFPTGMCDQIYKTCQAYVDSDKKEIAYLEQTLNLNECADKSAGCLGYLRDYNWSKLTGEEVIFGSQLSSRLDAPPMSDNAFTFAPNKFVDGFDESFGQDDLQIGDYDTNLKRLWLPDPSLYSENIILNSTGLVKSVPSLWQCTDNGTGKSCVYERIAGRKEGCKLPSGAYCDPWIEVPLTRCVDNDGKICYYDPKKEPPCSACNGAAPVETTPNAKTVLAVNNTIRLVDPAEDPNDRSQLYWCGLPGGAGCFVGKEPVDELKNLITLESPLRPTDPPRHTTQIAGIQCVVGAWKYIGGQYIFQAVPSINKTTPLTCSLYRQTQDETAIGNKRVYLTGNAQECSLDQAGCQEYWGVEFGSDVYTKVIIVTELATETEIGTETPSYFLTKDQKKEFVQNLLNKGLAQAANADFNYGDEDLIDINDLIPGSLKTAPDPDNFIKQYKTDDNYLKDITDFNQITLSVSDIGEIDAQIAPKPLNYQRQYCTEKDIDCRKYYPASGVASLAGILDPIKDLCPAQCVGYARYKEPVTPIEERLGTVVSIDGGEIKYPDITGTLDRYFIADREEQCPAQYAGCEYFIYKPNDAPSAKDLYLTDLRLCVNTKYYLDHLEYRAVYTIIESAAKGATNPVNIELVKSNYKEAVFYKIDGDEVKIFDTDTNPDCEGSCVELYSAGNYNAPCITMDPKGQGVNPDLWKCTDDNNFDKIELALERCLTVKTIEGGTKQVVSNLAKAECREYIYFPLSQGAERYALPNDLPIRVSSTCTAFKRGGNLTGAAIYNLDPESEVLKNVRCEEASVSCREYLGAGSSIAGPLSWVDFEDVEKWGERDEYGVVKADQPTPGKVDNVNGVEEAALQFNADKDYVYNILQHPSDIAGSEKLFRDNDTDKVKSFKLSLWAQADNGTEIKIGLRDSANAIAYFQVFKTGTTTPINYTTSDGKWRYIVFNQLFLDDPVSGFMPHYLYIPVAAGQEISLDSIVLEDSASIFRKQSD
ncbi:MAG: hypothetical protein ABH896_02370, partial [Candidatus Jacksonbacteria bacterium]